MAYSPTLGLTPTQLETYHQNGYLLLPSFLSPTTISALLSETNKLLTTIPLSTHPLTTFSTGESHVSDTYFLTSGDKIRFFFEEDAFEPDPNYNITPAAPAVRLSRPTHLAINKIGHALHSLSPPFRDATLSPRTAAIARSLNFQDPRVLQSMVICKQPRIGGAVPPHQDSEFLYTNPPSAVGFWIALQDAGGANGGLCFAKGSHRREGVRRRFVRKRGAEVGTEFVERWEGARFPASIPSVAGAQECAHDDESKEKEEEEYVLEEVQAGTLVLIHGNLLHKSERNTSGRSRFVYTFHVIEGAGGWIYDDRNWLQPPSCDGGGSPATGFTKLL